MSIKFQEKKQDMIGWVY